MALTNLDTRMAEFAASPEFVTISEAGRNFGKSVKSARLAASPAIAVEREGKTTEEIVADAYGMSTSSVGNYYRTGILMIADPKVDPAKAYAMVTRAEAKPSFAMIRIAADTKIGGDRRSVLTILESLVDAAPKKDEGEKPKVTRKPKTGAVTPAEMSTGDLAKAYAQITGEIVTRVGVDAIGGDEMATVLTALASLTKVLREKAATLPKAA